jgi:hypothetical protein
LLLDETWKLYNENRNLFEYKETKAFEREKYERGLAAAREKLGLDVYDKQTDRIEAGTSAKNAQIRASELELKRLRETRAKAKDRATIRQTDAKIRIEQEKLRLSKQKSRGKGSDAQKQETSLALDIIKDRATIIGKPQGGSGLGKNKVVGGMSYQQAYDYVRGQAEALMGSYRSSAYIDNWARQRLKTLGYTGPQKRSGR